MDNEQVATPAPAVAPTPEPSLADYRASREPNAGADRAGKDETKTAPETKAAPLEPGDPVVDDGDGETPADTPENQEAKKKKLGGFQKTIARQAAELDDLKRKLAGDKPADKPAPAAAVTTEKPADDLPGYAVAKPKLEDCASLEEFTEKIADWKADERDWRRSAEAGRAQAQADVKARSDNWNANVATFKTEHEDYDARMAAVADIKLSRLQQECLLDSPHGVPLAYELADDPEELARLSKLPPLAFARAIGKREAAFSEKADDAAEDKPIKVSSAPPPFRPGNGAANRGTPNPATLSAADYRKARESGRIH